MLILLYHCTHIFSIFNFIFTFLPSLFFSLIFHPPTNFYFPSPFLRPSPCILYTLLFNPFELHTIYSTFFPSLPLPLLTHYIPPPKKHPLIIFIVTPIIPLLPPPLPY
ncbi:threonine/serine exporter family protein, partial [Staphylococcus epidermidis]|uniref:threonine/serine exporter family protein n=1 Tax=Staphylococcus epidermidis TaxID=1282 RepID=UPI0037D9A83E